MYTPFSQLDNITAPFDYKSLRILPSLSLIIKSHSINHNQRSQHINPKPKQKLTHSHTSLKPPKNLTAPKT